MQEVSPEAVAYSKNLDFSFSNTLRNENVNLNNYNSYTFIIDVDGTVYQGANASESQASIVIIGGIDKFMHSKSTSLASNFFLTEQQTIYTNTALISSDNDTLEQALNSLYNNYCG